METSVAVAWNLVGGSLGTILTRLFVRGDEPPSFVRGPVVESLRAPGGARTSARLASWIKDTLELELNLCLLVEAFLQVLASGLGTLALVWATVVLLGGFSTMLGRMDFWFITAIVFVQTARIVGYNSAPEARFFVDLPGAFSERDISQAGTGSIKFVRLLTMWPTWFALAPLFLATACMSLSTIRLVSIIARHDYGSTSSADTCRNGNMKPALILFYALVLTQGALFLLWFAVAVIRWRLAVKLMRSFLNLSWDSREQLIERYVSSIAATCIEKGVSTTINTNLVSFAEELLLQSQHPDDHTSAVSVLHSLVIMDKKRLDKAVEQICSSEKLVYRLIRMLRSEDLDVGSKELIAEIVAKLSCKLRLADIPGAAHCISSLLDPHLMMMKTAGQTGRRDANLQPQGVNQRAVDIDSRGEIKPLFVHGLVILHKLAADPENCTEIYNTMDLVPKIIAPVSSRLHMVIKDDAMTVEIVRESLRVVAKLTSGTRESSRKLCDELTTAKYGRTAENILWILSNSSDEDLRMLAVEILSRLTLDEPVRLIRHLLLDPQDNQLRIEAGKALIARGDKFPDIQGLVTIMMSADAAYSKEYRAVITEMLAQICAKSTADQDTINRLRPVANTLSTVLKAIVVTVTTDITKLDKKDMKFVASCLGLAVQIREKLVTAQAFADAVTRPPLANNTIFAETLKRIIEVKQDSKIADEVCLAIMKSTTKLVTWMTEIDTISPYIEYFRREKIVDKLKAAVKAMVHLERYVVMTGGADEKEGYVTLQTLVEKASNILDPPPPQ